MTGTENIPWKVISGERGDVPFYVIQFDKHGNCTSPAALDHLLEAGKAKTDVFVFSHGWNNDWEAATNRYDRFVQRFAALRRQRWSPPDRSFDPALVGVFWPSTALVAPWERGPDIAGAGDEEEPDVAALADELDPDSRDTLRRIVARPAEHDPSELAKIVAPLLAGDDDEVGGDSPAVTAEDLLAAWQAVADQHPGEQPGGAPGGFIPDDDAGAGGTPGIATARGTAPATAGWNPIDKIRNAIRATTVLLMKDRAGRVGGNGVAEMLRRLADTSADTRISLVGHSYGAKIVLSALCNGPGPSRKVDSVLLLQPALSCLAFAANIDGRQGGYRRAFERVRLPIITTYSTHDQPLTKFFHLAVRRQSDLAEAVIAAPGQPPSKFAALGGYGPHGVDGEVDWIPMPAVGDPYPLSTGKRIIAAEGSAYISSHGAVEVPETAWALLSEVQA